MDSPEEGGPETKLSKRVAKRERIFDSLQNILDAQGISYLGKVWMPRSELHLSAAAGEALADGSSDEGSAEKAWKRPSSEFLWTNLAA